MAFCSYACESAYKASGAPFPPPAVGAPPVLSPHSSAPTPSNLPQCKYPGCHLPVFVGPSGPAEYCSLKHQQDALTAGWDKCKLSGCNHKVDPSLPFGGFCSKDHQEEPAKRGKCMYPGCDAARFADAPGEKPLDFCSLHHYEESLKLAEPFVRVLEKTEQAYLDVKKQFELKWTKKEYGVPIVQSIAQITMNGFVTKRYMDYRQKLVNRQPPIPVYGAGGPGNEQRRFHGTAMKCKLGLPGNGTLCSDSTCAVCGIIRTSFRISRAQSNISFARFGAGTYFTSTSSKCHDYNVKSEIGLGQGTGLRATFVVTLMLGLGAKLTEDHTTLKAPPPGYDSVLGETGDVLNYDEVVVYDDAASLPKYLVIYKALPPGSPVPPDVMLPRPAPSNAPTCQLAGCKKPVYMDPKTNQPFQYCSKSHAQQAASQQSTG